jgi:hypothetical protein
VSRFCNCLHIFCWPFFCAVCLFSFCISQVNFPLNCLLFCLLIHYICMFYTVARFVDTVASGLIYCHEILGIWCSIPQTSNGKRIVRAPGNPSSISPRFLGGFTTPWAQILVAERGLLLLRHSLRFVLPLVGWVVGLRPSALLGCGCVAWPCQRLRCTEYLGISCV